MPTNLPPEYDKAEERYKAASTPQEKITRLEELISTVPKHKGTDKLRADLRRRLSQLRKSAQKRQKASRHESAFHIDREGAGQVVIIGPANVGKSALLTALSNASPEVTDYPFATRFPTPGMMFIDGVQVQMIDTPPIDSTYIDPELPELIRRSDIILVVVDLQTYPEEQLETTIAFLREHRIAPKHLRSQYDERDRLTFIPLYVMANKYDDEELDELYELVCDLIGSDWPCLPISASTGRNLDRLKQLIFRELGVIRVYSKPPRRRTGLRNAVRFEGRQHSRRVGRKSSSRFSGRSQNSAHLGQHRTRRTNCRARSCPSRRRYHRTSNLIQQGSHQRS